MALAETQQLRMLERLAVRCAERSTRFAASVAIAKLGAIGGAGVRPVDRGFGLQQADADLPALLVDPLDHVPVELELADDYGGEVNPAGAQLVERHWLVARARTATPNAASAGGGDASVPSRSTSRATSGEHAPGASWGAAAQLTRSRSGRGCSRQTGCAGQAAAAPFTRLRKGAAAGSRDESSSGLRSGGRCQLDASLLLLRLPEGTSSGSLIRGAGTAHRSSCCCLDRRRERAKTACPCQGLEQTSPSRRRVRCREAATGRSPVEGLSMSIRNGTSWSGRCEES
jgi:hypothetical protein